MSVVDVDREGLLGLGGGPTDVAGVAETLHMGLYMVLGLGFLFESFTTDCALC